MGFLDDIKDKAAGLVDDLKGRLDTDDEAAAGRDPLSADLDAEPSAGDPLTSPGVGTAVLEPDPQADVPPLDAIDDDRPRVDPAL